MTWSYSSSTSNLDQVRLKIGDTISTDQIFSDEEINAQLSLTGNDPVQSAYNLLMSLAAQYARKSWNKSAGKYSEDLSKRAADLRAQAKALLDGEASIPAEEVAEQTFGDPQYPWDGSQEKDYEHRDDLRNGI